MPDNNPNMNSDAASEDAFAQMFNNSADEGDQMTIGDQPGQTAEPTSTSQSEGNQPPAGSPDGSANASNDSDSADQPQEEQIPDNAEDRIKYWQSRADKIAAEKDKLREQYEAQSPIMKYINENPQLASKVYQVVQEDLGGSSDNVPSPKGQANSQLQRPERPTKPEKPENYNSLDAVQDPDSESAKYREKMIEYNEQLVEYNEGLSDYQAKLEQQRQQELQQRQQQSQQIQEAYNEAVYRHGMQPKEAQDFIRWAQNPNYGMKELVQLYKLQNKANAGTNNASETIQDRNNRLNNPAPPVSQGNSRPDRNSHINSHFRGQPQNDDENIGQGFAEAIKGFSGQ